MGWVQTSALTAELLLEKNSMNVYCYKTMDKFWILFFLVNGIYVHLKNNLFVWSLNY